MKNKKMNMEKNLKPISNTAKKFSQNNDIATALKNRLNEKSKLRNNIHKNTITDKLLNKKPNNENSLKINSLKIKENKKSLNQAETVLAESVNNYNKYLNLSIDSFNYATVAQPGRASASRADVLADVRVQTLNLDESPGGGALKNTTKSPVNDKFIKNNFQFNYSILPFQFKILAFFISLLLIAMPVLADSWTPSQPSHSTLYADTITSKTDASPVNVADAQGLFVTGDVTTLGKVGIGTTGPTSFDTGSNPQILQVHKAGSTTAGGLLQLSTDQTAASTAVGIISFGSTGLSNADKRIAEIAAMKTDAATTGGTGDLTFATWNGGTYGEKMRILANGNVGIGTTNPKRALHLGNSGELVFENPSMGVDQKIIRLLNRGSYLEIGTTNDAVTTDQTMIASFGRNGNVGIGTTSPGYKLEVNGELKLPKALFGYATLDSIPTISTESVFTGGSGDLGFRIKTTGGNVPGFFVQATTGNVGIGTTSPGEKLDVSSGFSDGGIAIHQGDTLDRIGALAMCAGLVSRTCGYGSIKVVKSNGVSCESACNAMDCGSAPYCDYYCYGSVGGAKGINLGDVGAGNTEVASSWFGVGYCDSTNGMNDWCCCKSQYNSAKGC